MPPKGTAGLARSRVKGQRRSPCPPANRTPIALRIRGMRAPGRGRSERHSTSMARGCRKFHREKPEEIMGEFPIPKNPNFYTFTVGAGREIQIKGILLKG